MRRKTANSKRKAAGPFSGWLHAFVKSMETGGEMDVACGDCVACCKSSYFIHVRPSDSDAFDRIPRELLFAAPGMPEGHFVMGVNQAGHCPMFSDGKCGIYPWRPLTCRQYDCRVLFAVAPLFCPEARPAVGEAAYCWQFTFETDEDKQRYDAVQQAACFLKAQKDLFSKDVLPQNEEQLALLAIRIHELFMTASDDVADLNDKVASIEAIITR